MPETRNLGHRRDHMLNPWLYIRVRFWRRWTRHERQGAVIAGVVVLIALAVAILIHAGAGVP